jgi:hypothetical protein
MKLFFTFLYLESRHTGKPIVYLMHPVEFAPRASRIPHKDPNENLSTVGFSFRTNLKTRLHHTKRLHLTSQLLRYMSRFSNTAFMTVNDYVRTIRLPPTDQAAPLP